MEFRVDFTSENILPDGSNFGKVGEHNAATLVITPPAEMTDNPEIFYICLACEVGSEFIKTVVRSEMYEKAAEIRVPLWGQATVGESAKLQLEGYDGNDNILIKSELIDYVLSPSANGVQAATDMSGGSLAATVAANKKGIEELAQNGGGKVKKIFIPYDADLEYGCYAFTNTEQLQFFVSNTFTEEKKLSDIIPVELTIKWKGVEMSLAELEHRGVVGYNLPAFTNLLNPVDVDETETDKLFALINNTAGSADSLYTEVGNSNNNGYIGGVYLYYFDTIEEVK